MSTMYMRTWVLVFVAFLGGATGICSPSGGPGTKGFGFDVLTPGAVVPPSGSSASGFFYFQLDIGNGHFTFDITTTTLSSAVTGMTLHCDPTGDPYSNAYGNASDVSCTPGTNCPVCLDLMGFGGQAITLKKQLVDQIVWGKAYFLVSTVAYPNGELRGYGQANCALIEDNYEYFGPNIDITTAATAEICCVQCERNPMCNYWTYVTDNSSFGFVDQCFQKAEQGIRRVSNISVSGEPAVSAFVQTQGLPQFTATLSHPLSPYKAYAVLHIAPSTSDYLMHIATTVPGHLNPQLFSGMAAPNAAGGLGELMMNFTGVQLVTLNGTLDEAEMQSLLNFTHFLEIQIAASHPDIRGWFLPTDITPKVDMPPAGAFDVELYPKLKRGFDQGSITVAVSFASSTIGNEIWVMLPAGFEASPGVTSAIYVQGAAPPKEVVVIPETNQVQLRWNHTVPFYSTPSIAFTITNVAFPNNCDLKAYTIQTASCHQDDFMGAGVLFYRKCVPSPSDVTMTATPATGAPAGCRADGCNSCKYLYTSPINGQRVHTCEHDGQTTYRTDISQCEACAYANTWEA